MRKDQRPLSAAPESDEETGDGGLAEAAGPLTGTASSEDVKRVEYDGNPRCEHCMAGVFDEGQEMGGCRRDPPVHTQFVIPATQLRADAPPFRFEGVSQNPFVRRGHFCISGFRLRTELQQ